MTASATGPAPPPGESGYAALLKAVRFMAALPPGADMHVNAETHQDAAAALGLLQLLDVRPPRVFAPDEDTVAFTWDCPGCEYLLAVGEGSASLLKVAGQDTAPVAHAVLGSGPAFTLAVGIRRVVGRKGRRASG